MYPGFHAVTQPDKPAVVMGRTGEVVTYRELDERSARLARLLHASGLRPGDKIAILAENHPRYYEVYWAAVRSGLYLAAVNSPLRTRRGRVPGERLRRGRIDQHRRAGGDGDGDA